MADYPISSALTLYAVIRDEAGSQVTPSSVAVRVREPDGTIVDLEPVEVEAEDLDKAAAAIGETLTGVSGVYQVQMLPDVAGTWDVHWQSESPTRAIYSYFQVPWPKVPAATS